METIKTTNKDEFFSLLTKLKSERKEWITSDKMKSPKAFNYILITDTTFTFISKKEYEFWNR